MPSSVLALVLPPLTPCFIYTPFLFCAQDSLFIYMLVIVSPAAFLPSSMPGALFQNPRLHPLRAASAPLVKLPTHPGGYSQ